LETPTRLPRHPSLTELDELCISTIRCLAIDAIQKSKSGHPGLPMGMAPAGYTLWTRHLKHNPGNPLWPNRDRFVLSAGHGCMLLYSLLHLTGYDLTLEEIKNFRQWGTRTPGHPEYGLTPGVEVTTGPLGQGVGNAVGMAIAGKYLAGYFNRDGFPIVDYKVYAFAGDGCMMEGVASEAASLGGHLGLDNLIVVYDDNKISIDGPTTLAFGEDVAKRFEAYEWFVQTVDGDGNDMAAFERALEAAKKESRRPSLIKLRTHIGYGSPHKQDTSEVHGSPLGDEEIALTKQRYGWDPALKFHVPPEALTHFREQVAAGQQREAEWNALFARYAAAHPDLARQWERALAGALPEEWEKIWKDATASFAPGGALATREAQGKVLDATMPGLPFVIGGSADLTPSNNTRFKGVTDFSSSNRIGRYLRYGVREHAMGAIMNGIAVSKMLVPYGATFLAFADYMRAPIRLAALSHYPTIFIFTHDSIGLGEDGPTHQAVEQLASLRAIPNLIVLRPADAFETAAAWRFALEHRTGPVVIALTRQKLPILDQTRFAPASNLVQGGYVLSDAPGARALLVAAGSEVHQALKAKDLLAAEGINARVVSMPSCELFEKQSDAYKASVIPPSMTARVVIEAGVRQGWDAYMGPRGEFIGMSTFGASAPVEVVFAKFGITPEHIAAAAKRALS
jgi:transketolase